MTLWVTWKGSACRLDLFQLVLPHVRRGSSFLGSVLFMSFLRVYKDKPNCMFLFNFLLSSHLFTVQRSNRSQSTNGKSLGQGSTAPQWKSGDWTLNISWQLQTIQNPILPYLMIKCHFKHNYIYLCLYLFHMSYIYSYPFLRIYYGMPPSIVWWLSAFNFLGKILLYTADSSECSFILIRRHVAVNGC